MSWILGAVYCGLLWLVFAKLRLLKMSLPMAILAGSVGPSLIVALLFCAQYFHPYTSDARVFKQTIPIVPQLRQPGRVLRVEVKPNTPVSKGDLRFSVDPIPYPNTVERLKSAVAEAQQAKKVAEQSVVLAEAGQTRAEANLKFATADRDRKEQTVQSLATSKEEYEQAVTRYAEAVAAVSQSEAALVQARLNIDLASEKIRQLEAQLADAQYDLAQTTVTAPEDGYVTNLQLRSGALVGGSTGAVMSFVVDSSELTEGIVVAAFEQKNFLRIKQGQYCEVALNGYPGEIFSARVENVIDISGAGQLLPTGVLPESLGASAPSKFAVRIRLDEGDKIRLPGGSQATVAVYTEDVQIAGIPVMFLIRAQSWIRYII